MTPRSQPKATTSTRVMADNEPGITEENQAKPSQQGQRVQKPVAPSRNIQGSAAPASSNLTAADLMRVLETLRIPPPKPPQTPATTPNAIPSVAQYDSTRDEALVSTFTARVDLFKQLNAITDNQPLLGFTLLLEGEAHTWWEGLRSSISS